MDLHTLFEEAGRSFEARAYETALSGFNKILETDSDHLGALFGRARSLLNLERFPECLATYEVLVRKYPTNSDALSEKGVILFRAGRLDDALVAMNKAVDLDPSNPYRYSSRAYIRARMNDVFGAVEDYKKAVELDPEDAVAYNNLGLLEEKMGFDSAKDYLKRADELTGGRSENRPSPTQAENRQGESNREEDESRETGSGQKPESENTAEPKFTAKDYGRVIRETFRSGESFQEFLDFVKNKINPKK